MKWVILALFIFVSNGCISSYKNQPSGSSNQYNDKAYRQVVPAYSEPKKEVQKNPKPYFTLGSSANEVLAVQGKP